MERVEHPDDPRLSDYRELRDAAARRRIEGDEFFIAEGPVAIERLVASDHEVRSVIVSDRKYERMQALLDTVDAPIYVVARDVLHELVGFDLHRGAIAAADRQPRPDVADLIAAHRTIAILEGLNDPENLGAIARSARALGIEALILDPTCIDPYTRRTVRVSMGEILHLPAAATTSSSWAELPDTLASAGFETWALTPDNDADNLWELQPPDRVAVLLGAEGPGLSAASLNRATRRVRIPIRADVDSLNVGAAAAIAFAAITRER